MLLFVTYLPDPQCPSGSATLSLKIEESSINPSLEEIWKPRTPTSSIQATIPATADFRIGFQSEHSFNIFKLVSIPDNTMPAPSLSLSERAGLSESEPRP